MNSFFRFLISIFVLSVCSSSGTLADDRSKFLEFYRAKITTFAKTHDGIQFVASETRKVPMDIQKKYRIGDTATRYRWRVKGECRICEDFKIEAGKKNGNSNSASVFNQDTTAQEYFIKNTRYHAHISIRDGKNLLGAIYHNKARVSEEDCAIDHLSSVPFYVLTFGKLASDELSRDVKWDRNGSGNFLLTCRLAIPKNAEEDFSAEFTDIGRVVRVVRRNISDAFEIETKMAYVDEASSNLSKLKSVTQLAGSIDAKGVTDWKNSIVTTTTIENLRPESLTEEECRLPAFGLPEPREFQFGTNWIWRTILIVGVGLLLTGILLRALGWKRR
jgi:hypothetical protein